MKSVLIAAGIAAVALGGAFAVYKYQQGQPKDPGQQKQAAAPMPVQPNPAPFAQQQLAYAPGASPTLVQLGQGLQLGSNAIDVAKKLGFFSDDDDEG